MAWLAGWPAIKKLVTPWCDGRDMWEFLALSLFSGEARLSCKKSLGMRGRRTVVTLILINIVCDSQPSELDWDRQMSERLSDPLSLSHQASQSDTQAPPPPPPPPHPLCLSHIGGEVRAGLSIHGADSQLLNKMNLVFYDVSNNIINIFMMLGPLHSIWETKRAMCIWYFVN